MPAKRVVSGIVSLTVVLAALTMTASAQNISVTAANPNNAAQGTVNLNVTVSGKGFKNGAAAKWFVTGTTNPGGVTVNSTSFQGNTMLLANITVAADAALANFDVVVTNTDGSSGKGTELFTVHQNGGNNSGSCQSQNIAVNVIFAPGNSGQRLLYGDSDFGTGSNTYYNANDPEFNGGSLYSFGAFQICSASNDMTLNLNTTGRTASLAFTQQLSPPQSGAVDVNGHTYPVTFFNLRAAYDTPLGGSMNTCFGPSPDAPNSQTWYFRFENPSTYYQNAGKCETGGSGISAVVNEGADTSLVTIQHPDSCTWIVHPQPDSSGFYRAGLAEDIKKTLFFGGQYNVPWAMKLVLGQCL